MAVYKSRSPVQLHALIYNLTLNRFALISLKIMGCLLSREREKEVSIQLIDLNRQLTEIRTRRDKTAQFIKEIEEQEADLSTRLFNLENADLHVSCVKKWHILSENPMNFQNVCNIKVDAFERIKIVAKQRHARNMKDI